MRDDHDFDEAGEAEAAADAADQQRKYEKEHPSTEVERIPGEEDYGDLYHPTEAELQEAREAREHFDERVEVAKQAGAPSEEVVQEHQRGFQITLTFKVPFYFETGNLSWMASDRAAKAIMAEAHQIDDSWDHQVDVQEWRR